MTLKSDYDILHAAMSAKERAMRYKLRSVIQNIVQVNTTRYIRGVGQEAEFEEVPTGEYRIHLGGFGVIVLPEKPDFKIGNMLTITIEAHDA